MKSSLRFVGLAAVLVFVGCGSDGDSTQYVAGGSDAGADGEAGAGGSAGSSGSGGSGVTGGSGGTSATGGTGGTAETGGTGGTGTAGAGGTGGTSDPGDAGPLYSIAGSVVGLTGSGLVLQNNGTNDLAVAAAGNFEFSAKLPTAAAYAVTVSTQPTNPSQLCAVENGTGTVAGQDVADVAVTCETQSYQVGGWVSGLLGTGLVLRNNGADDLPVAANGPFVFSTAVQSGASYAVTVGTQPQGPAQVCTVQSGSGTVGAQDVQAVQVDCALPDSDSDGIPDIGDPFPNDPNRPGQAALGTVYAHTSSRLFTFDVVSFAIQEIGLFKGSGFAGSVTDVAVSGFGVLYAVTFDDLYVCHPGTAECWQLATLPTSFNGLTMVPPGTLDPVLDVLVGVANNGSWYRMDVASGQAQLTSIGGYGNGYSSSGDAFSIEGVGTYASVNKTGVSSVMIVEVSPTTGAVTSELATLTNYYGVYGLAGWDGQIFAFDSSGAVVRVDVTTGAFQLLHSTPHAWWGAGVKTRLDQ